LANHKSAIKRAKQSEARRLRNRARKTRMKTAVRGLDEAIAAGSRDAVVESLQQAISIIAKTAGKGVIHRNTASRKISRLTRRVNAMATG
jgi:small subunit ribosomal protein S20